MNYNRTEYSKRGIIPTHNVEEIQLNKFLVVQKVDGSTMSNYRSMSSCF